MKSTTCRLLSCLASLALLLGGCSQGGPSQPASSAGKAEKKAGGAGAPEVKGPAQAPKPAEPAKPLPKPESFGKHPVVEITTSLGTFEITLDAEKAPKTVKNFLTYCLEGFYEGTVFHRILPGFVVQGGGKVLLGKGILRTKRPTHPPVPNEAGNGLTHVRGAVAMARTPDPDSATCQFYVVLKKKPYLDEKRYTVFGKVTKGMDVIDKIASVKLADPKRGVPVDPPVIEKVVVRKSL